MRGSWSDGQPFGDCSCRRRTSLAAVFCISLNRPLLLPAGTSCLLKCLQQHVNYCPHACEHVSRMLTCCAGVHGRVPSYLLVLY
jgi:hypothetical protein